MVQYYLDMIDATKKYLGISIPHLAKLYHQRFFIKNFFCHSRQFRILSYFLLTVPGKTSKTDRNSCSHQLCECDREFAMCLQKYLPCPKSKAVCKNKKRLWQNLLMGFGSGKGVHDPKHKVCCLPSRFMCVTILWNSFRVFPSRGKAHLNDVRFKSNWVFFTNIDCMKIDIQY